MLSKLTLAAYHHGLLTFYSMARAPVCPCLAPMNTLAGMCKVYNCVYNNHGNTYCSVLSVSLEPT